MSNGHVAESAVKAGSTGDSKIVFGVGASHTTLMNTRWDMVDHLDRAHRFRDALGEARTQLAGTKPDLVIIIGSNHYRGFWLDLMPAFTIGVDQVIGAGEHGTPSGPQSVDSPAAMHLLESMLAADFDMAFSSAMQVDHGITHAIQYLVPTGVPVVPIVINTFGPPLPTLRRCKQLGEALAAAVSSLPTGRRVAIIGTGGLSHQIPFPDWRDPRGDDEEFLARSFREGRGNWAEFEERRRPIIVNAKPQINVEFDQAFLARLEAGALAAVASEYSTNTLMAAAGNGGNEIRAWLAMAAALDHRPGQTLCYSPMPEWLTGMAVATINPTQSHQ